MSSSDSVLVPREPTEAMLDAAQAAWTPGVSHDEAPRIRWAAMLAASPQQSAEPLDALIDDAFDKMAQQPADGRLTSTAGHNRPNIGDSIPRPAYITSGPHLSGYQVKIGYETLAEAQDAHQALASPQQSPISGEGWRSMDSLPHPKDAGLFWAAIQTCGINSPLQWEVHVIALDDETHEIHASYYQGWNIDQYEFWWPCVAPPVPSVLVGEGQGSNRKGDLPTEQAADSSSDLARAWEILATIPAINDLGGQYQEDIQAAILTALQTKGEQS